MTIVPLWHVLRSWCVPKVAQVTLTISVLGTLLLASEAVWPKVARYFCDCEDFGFRALWRLYTIYYGSIVFVIGATLFNLLCRPVIKAYASVLDYVDDKAKIASDTHFGATIAELSNLFNSAGNSFPEQKAMYVQELGDTEGVRKFPVTVDQTALGTKYRNKLGAIVRIDYAVQDAMYPFRRLVVAFLLIAGMVAMALPTLWTIWVITGRLI